MNNKISKVFINRKRAVSFIFMIVLLADILISGLLTGQVIYQLNEDLPQLPSSDKKELDLCKKYLDAAAQEMVLDESDIIGAINRWHQDVYPRNRHVSTAYLMAMLLDPVTTEISEEIREIIHKYDTTESKIKHMHQWLQTNMVHTQIHSAFKEFPGRDPWGVKDLYSFPTYKKLMPSEMKAMRLHTDRISGKCMTLANLVTSIFIQLGVPPENIILCIVKVHSMQHGVALVKFEDEVIFVNNNGVDMLYNMPKNGPMQTQPLITVYNHQDLRPIHFLLTSNHIDADILSENDFLFPQFVKYLGLMNQVIDFGPWPKYSYSDVRQLKEEIFLNNKQSIISDLAKYVYQSLYVKYPGYYLTASLMSSLPRDLAATMESVDDVFHWIKSHIRLGSIFPDCESRLMTADQVLVFQQGSLKDQAVLAYTLLKHIDYDPILYLTSEGAYVEVNSNIYSLVINEVITQIKEPVLVTLKLREQFPGLRKARRKAHFGIQQKQYDRASQNLHANIKQYPDAWEVYHDIGDLYQIRKQYKNAIESFQKAETLHTGNVLRLNLLAWLCLLANQPQKAITFCEKGLSYEPGNSSLKINMIHGLVLSGDFDKSKTYFLENQSILINDKSIKTKILEDFQTMKEAGIQHAGIDQFTRFVSNQMDQE